ncbi:unnamed protein product [Macrosiphum euphorbiae]|uniref:RNA-directed DNA polymerase n=1 Tax=Macrosiphum euphorbiae TaxID=13131 RepID=A0AAV0YB34_9HEMI|nr:unnamed protein product [Macrosiphum euphorbiae]
MDSKIPKEMNFSGNIEANWKSWKQRLSLYLLASNKNTCSDETKTAILLTLLGEEGINIYNTFTEKQIYDEKKVPIFQKVIAAFDEYCLGKKNIVFERFNFLKYKRQHGQSLENFITQLKLLAASCEYGQLTDSIIRDQIIINTSDVVLQEQLINKSDLSLEKTIEILKQSENVKHQIEIINKGEKEESEYPHVDAIKRKNKYNTNKNKVTQANFQCSRCGTQHPARNCPAFGKQCKKCAKPNHFANVCRSNKMVQEIADEECADEECAAINSLFGVSEIIVPQTHSIQQPWFEEIKVENNYIRFKLDTGSQVNLIPLNVYKTLNINKSWNSTTIKLEAYGGYKFMPLGSIRLKCVVNNIMAWVTFLIINNSTIPILSLEACEKFNLIKRHEKCISMITQCTSQKDNFLIDNSSIFKGMGTFPGEHTIKINPNSQGSIKPARRLPQTLYKDVQVELNKLLKHKIISKVEEPKEWASNFVIIRKPDKKLRLCIDPSELNKSLKRDNYLIPTFEEIRSKLINKKIFTVLDIKKGFWHVKLDSKSSDLCTFSTPFGYFKFNRLPFGIATAPEIFIKLNQKYFGDIDDENIIIYFDDILIATTDETSHDRVLKKLVDRAKALNIKFNKDKLQFKKTEIKYVGHIFNEQGVSPDPDQIKAIVSLKEPTSRVELQRLIGMFNYLREFIPNMSKIISPLRELLKKDTIWVWEKRHHLALKELKELVTTSPILTHFNPDKEITIQCDASKDGLGCCLLQDKKPIAFASRSMSETEISYAQIEKEFLSLIFACRKFHYYIFGRTINALTDHKPLVSIMQKDVIKIPSNRLQKMRLKLLEYDIRLKYLPGKKMHIADLLSRDYMQETFTEEFDTGATVHCINRFYNNNLLNIKTESELDPVLNKIIEYYYQGWPNRKHIDKSVQLYYNLRNEIIIENGIIYVADKIVIPTKLRPLILKLLHESHLGLNKTKLRAKQIIYWPGMFNEIEQFINNCNTCNKFQNSNKKSPLIPHEVPNYPYEKVGADILSFEGTDYLVIVDYYSKWFDLIKLKYKTASEIIKKSKQIFSTHGIPKTFIADNMPFNSSEFITFSKTWNFTVVTSSPHYPQSNGLAERTVQTSKKLLKKALEEGCDVEAMLLEYRCTPIISLQASPAELLFSRILRTKLPIANKLLEPRLQHKVQTKLKAFQQKYKSNYDKTATKKETQFKPNTNILIQNNKVWLPGKVIAKANAPRSYLVENNNGTIIRRNTKHLKNTKINVTGNSN